MKPTEREIEIYFKYIKIVQSIQLAQNSNLDFEPISETELIQQLSDFQAECTLWASPHVLNAYDNFRTIGDKDNGKAVLLAIDPIIRSMRKDIGLSNRGLDKHHFMKMALADPTELDDYIQSVE